MNRTSILSGALALLLLAPLATQAQISKKGAGYVFRYKWTQGKQYKFSTTVSTVQNGKATPMMSTTHSMKVAKVVGNTATINYEAKVPQQISGKEGGSTEKGSFTVNQMGELQGASAAQLREYVPQMPKDAIKLEGTWKRTTDVPTQFGQMKTEQTYRLAKIERVGNRQVALVRVGLNMTGAQADGKGHGTIRLDLADGVLWDSSVKLSMTIKGGEKPMTFPIQVDLKRQ